jgi:ssDNA-binding Zn-finger/Zn-ribbon topoisomerase 1
MGLMGIMCWVCPRCGSRFSTSRQRHAVKCGCGAPMVAARSRHGRIVDCGDFLLTVVAAWE